MGEELTVKNITEIINEKFIIPKYQRGYRWDEKQILALLKDITDHPQNSKYCLQPIVVWEDDGKWELLDGQQRLTTIYIIIRFMKQYRPKMKTFSLEFATRHRSAEFLEELTEETICDESNIDFYYISSAMKYINEWFANYPDPDTAVNNFSQKLFNDVQIIWYNIGKSVSEIEKNKIFNRLNIGKIPLTSAELIKAVLLNESNFASKNSNAPDLKYAKIKQFEIATEWDQIENELQGNSFWYFLSKNKSDYDTRIELLFDLISTGEISDAKKSDPLWIFLYFHEQIQESTDKEEFIKEKWKKVKHTFMILREWYNDHKLYHYIGFLLSLGSPLAELLASYESMTKVEFFDYIKNEIAKFAIRININELEFINKKDKEEITKILLLHNIHSVVEYNSDLKFSFEKFHAKKWSLEHIHAQNSEELRTEAQWKDWLHEHKDFLGDGFKMPEKITKEEFNKLSQKVYKTYEEQNEIDPQEADHSIANLALLSSEDNSALSNSIFPIKRAKLLSLDKEGKFIPICTKNAFFKYFNTNIEQSFSFWSKEDKELYFDDIKKTLNYFLGEQHEQ